MKILTMPSLLLDSALPLHGFTPTETSNVSSDPDELRLLKENAKIMKEERDVCEKSLQQEKNIRLEIGQAAKKILAKFKKVKSEQIENI